MLTTRFFYPLTLALVGLAPIAGLYHMTGQHGPCWAWCVLLLLALAGAGWNLWHMRRPYRCAGCRTCVRTGSAEDWEAARRRGFQCDGRGRLVRGR